MTFQSNYWSSAFCRTVMAFSLIVVLSIGFQSESAKANAEPEIKVYLNDHFLEFPQPPVLRQDVTLVPFRVLFEGMGMEVEWDHSRKTVIGEKEGLTIELPVDEPYAYINGVRTALDQPAALVENHTMVPLRFVSESTGALVMWYAQLKEIGVFEEAHIASLGMTKEEFEEAMRQQLEEFELPEAPVDEESLEEDDEYEDTAEWEYVDQVDPSLLKGMYLTHRPDYGGYECGGICWDFYTFLDDSRIVLTIPEGGGPETIHCSTDTCHAYTISGDELVLDDGTRLLLRMTTDGYLEIDNQLVYEVDPVESGLQMEGLYTYTGSSGTVGMGNANTWVRSVQFYSDGTFESDSFVSSSFDTGVSSTHTGATDQDHGTYAISGNTITFTFSDGMTASELFFLHDGDIEFVQIGVNNYFGENYDFSY